MVAEEAKNLARYRSENNFEPNKFGPSLKLLQLRRSLKLIEELKQHLSILQLF